MKHRFIAAATALTIAAPISAQTAENIAFCGGLGSMAAVIMEARQTGAPMSNMLALAASSDDPVVADMARAFVLDAYQRPQWATDDAQLDEVNRFRNSIEMLCFEAFRPA
jgi:predicted mannosyl-3-phosphoglycerate phosphatase (HAD superfamily)